MVAGEEHHTESAGAFCRFEGSSFASLTQTRFDPEREHRPFVFVNLRTPLPAQKLQSSCFQKHAHSLTCFRNLTPAFSCTSTLLVLSCTKERKSTPLFSAACARFCGYGGYAESSDIANLPLETPALHALWQEFNIQIHYFQVRARSFVKVPGGRGLTLRAVEALLQLSKQALRHRPFGFRIDETTAEAQTLGLTC
jgi:hypothetical protein